MESQIKPGTVFFEDFRFDIGLCRLWRRGEDGAWTLVAIGSRALDVLAVLLREPGVLVPKDAIMRQVWPGIAVEANNLTVQITMLRKVLDRDRASESCIQTVSGRGYRFVAPVAKDAVEHGGEQPGEGWDKRQNATPDGPPRAPTPDVADQQPPNESRLAPPSAERRQLTIMSCGVVAWGGISSHLDPEDLREVTTAYHRCCADIIERHHGYGAAYSNDGVVAYFGYPQADEHDAERAIQTGLALIDAVPKLATAAGVPLHVGLGIATGLVVADPVGSGPAGAVTVVGDTPNLAARMQTIAGAGQIVTSALTCRLVGHAFELTDLGELNLKGIAEPVHCWRVVRGLMAESRFDAFRAGSVPDATCRSR